MKPENLLIAVIHGLGKQVKIQDDDRMATVFGKAAEAHPQLFGVFAPHPAYGDSERLHEAFQSLVHGGSLTKPNASLDPYIPATRVISGYGKSVLESLPQADQEKVLEVSKQLLDAFSAQK